MAVVFDAQARFGTRAPVVVIGAGACGLTAALAAKDAGADVLVIERDPHPSGSTALSSGFIPAAHTRYQRAAGVDDSPANMIADIWRKNHGTADAAIVEALCRASASTLEWLADAHGLPFILVEGFLYPGHGVPRMHALPEKTGTALIGALERAAGTARIDVVVSAQATELVARADRSVSGIRVRRPDGAVEAVGCDALVLASSGFGGNAAMVREHLPEIAHALYFGHPGNQGDALRWGAALGAAVHDLGSYQGHGSVAIPHGILITWALMMNGGIQVNAHGERFSNEHAGYSEQCLPVIRQPGGFAWDVYDERLHRLGMEFPDYREADSIGAVKRAPDAAALARALEIPAAALARTLAEAARCAAGRATDPFGRDFTHGPPLAPPYHAIKVTGALFHTQGGLEVDSCARVLDATGTPLPNLLAGGGAARGVSGAQGWGYLSGNGLLSAVVLGRLAGREAARIAAQAQRAAS